MGWRVLKYGYLNVNREQRWVSLMYDAYTKCMKLEVKEYNYQTIPQISLIINPQSVSLTFDSNDARFIVGIQTQMVGSINIHISDEISHNIQDRMQWQALFRTAANPAVMYSVIIIQAAGDREAILYVNEHDVQLSTVQCKNGGKSYNAISTDIDKVSMTIENSLIFTMDRQHVTLRTDRLIELYQHLLHFSGGGKLLNNAEEFAIARIDYENIRRGSRDNLRPDDDDIYVSPSTFSLLSPQNTPRNSPRCSPQSSPRVTPHISPSPAPKQSSHCPKLHRSAPSMPSGPPPSSNPPKLSSPSPKLFSPPPKFSSSPPKISSSPPKLSSPPPKLSSPSPKGRSNTASLSSPSNEKKPKPPPKPANSKEILYQFNKSVSNKRQEPLYKSVRKDDRKGRLSVPSAPSFKVDDDPPPLPPTSIQYMDMDKVGSLTSDKQPQEDEKNQTILSGTSIYESMEQFIDDETQSLPPTPDHYINMNEASNMSSFDTLFQNYDNETGYVNVPKKQNKALHSVESISDIRPPSPIDDINIRANNEDFEEEIYERYEDMQSLRGSTTVTQYHRNPPKMPTLHPNNSNSDSSMNRVNKLENRLGLGTLILQSWETTARHGKNDSDSDVSDDSCKAMKKGRKLSSIFYD